MKEMDRTDVDILRLGLNQVAKLCAAAREAAPGLPGQLIFLGDIGNRIVLLKEALDEPANQLVTPPARKTPPPAGGIR